MKDESRFQAYHIAGKVYDTYMHPECSHFHRLEGPAVTSLNRSYKEWWIDGKELSEEEFNNHPARRKYLLQKKIENILKEVS